MASRFWLCFLLCVCVCNHLPSTVLTWVLLRLIKSLGSTRLFTLEKTWIRGIVIIINCGFIGLFPSSKTETNYWRLNITWGHAGSLWQTRVLLVSLVYVTWFSHINHFGWICKSVCIFMVQCGRLFVNLNILNKVWLQNLWYTSFYEEFVCLRLWNSRSFSCGQRLIKEVLFSYQWYEVEEKLSLGLQTVIWRWLIKEIRHIYVVTFLPCLLESINIVLSA